MAPRPPLENSNVTSHVTAPMTRHWSAISAPMSNAIYQSLIINFSMQIFVVCKSTEDVSTFLKIIIIEKYLLQWHCNTLNLLWNGSESARELLAESVHFSFSVKLSQESKN